MVYKDLQRQDLGKKFLCQAANTNLTIPVSREVKVLLNCEFIFLPYFLLSQIQVTMLNGCKFTLYPGMLYQLHVKASLLKQLTHKYFTGWKKLPQTMTLFKLGVIVNDTLGI